MKTHSQLETLPLELATKEEMILKFEPTVLKFVEDIRENKDEEELISKLEKLLSYASSENRVNMQFFAFIENQDFVSIFFEIFSAYGGKHGEHEKTINYLLLSILSNWVYYGGQAETLCESRDLVSYVCSTLGSYLCGDEQKEEQTSISS